MQDDKRHARRCTLPALFLALLVAGAGCTFARAAAQEAAAGGDVLWAWAGGVTDESAVVKAKLAQPGPARLLLASATGETDVLAPVSTDDRAGDGGRILTFALDGLAARATYTYTVILGEADREAQTAPDPDGSGHFATFAPPGEPESITVAFGSCARTGSTHPVFDTIRGLAPDLFIHMGDFHYENITANDPALFDAAFDAVLASPAQSALYRSLPIAYVWDDHDFGANNSDGSNPAAPAARSSYRAHVPHYPLPADEDSGEDSGADSGADGPIYQAFSAGRIRFIVTDTRSEKSWLRRTMLGDEQKAWLKQELLAARDAGYALIVWVQTDPWIGAAKWWLLGFQDNWGAFAGERREIANFLVDNGIDNLIMLSGDAHMLAIDDGTHSNYAGEAGKPADGPGFPIMHAAALDQKGSVKGGPYSEGTLPGGGHFGYMTITDDGGDIGVRWQGMNEAGETLMELSFTVSQDGIKFFQR